MTIEDLKQHLRTTPIERQWEKPIPLWEKPRLPIEMMDNVIGKLAIDAVEGREPPDDLFVLLTAVFMVGISHLVVEGEPLDMQPEPIIFAKPYYEKTMKLVEHLTATGYMKMTKQNSRGSMYALVFPQDRAKRQEWMQAVLDACRDFLIREKNLELERNRALSRELLDKMPDEQKWKRQYVQRMHDEHREDCFLCDTKDAGVYIGVQRIPDEDPRVPEFAKGMNIIFAFGLCPQCYELPDVETKVLAKIVDTDKIV